MKVNSYVARTAAAQVKLYTDLSCIGVPVYTLPIFTYFSVILLENDAMKVDHEIVISPDRIKNSQITSVIIFQLVQTSSTGKLPVQNSKKDSSASVLPAQCWWQPCAAAAVVSATVHNKFARTPPAPAAAAAAATRAALLHSAPPRAAPFEPIPTAFNTTRYNIFCLFAAYTHSCCSGK